MARIQQPRWRSASATSTLWLVVFVQGLCLCQGGHCELWMEKSMPRMQPPLEGGDASTTERAAGGGSAPSCCRIDGGTACSGHQAPQAQATQGGHRRRVARGSGRGGGVHACRRCHDRGARCGARRAGYACCGGASGGQDHGAAHDGAAAAKAIPVPQHVGSSQRRILRQEGFANGAVKEGSGPGAAADAARAARQAGEIPGRGQRCHDQGRSGGPRQGSSRTGQVEGGAQKGPANKPPPGCWPRAGSISRKQPR